MYCDKTYDGMPGLCHVLINVKKFKDKQQEKGTVFKVIDDKFTKQLARATNTVITELNRLWYIRNDLPKQILKDVETIHFTAIADGNLKYMSKLGTLIEKYKDLLNNNNNNENKKLPKMSRTNPMQTEDCRGGG